MSDAKKMLDRIFKPQPQGEVVNSHVVHVAAEPERTFTGCKHRPKGELPCAECLVEEIYNPRPVNVRVINSNS